MQVARVPALVCLTFADKLYAEHMTKDGQYPQKDRMKDKLITELSVSYRVGEGEELLSMRDG